MTSMEPLTTLQRLGENLEYSELMDAADGSRNSIKRLALVTAFAISRYAAHERPFKPFDALLGETFQLEDDERGRFVAEQVSTQPPIAVAHGENGHFTLDVVSSTEMPSKRRSAQPVHTGRCMVTLKATQETFSVSAVASKLNGSIFNRFVDHEEELVVVNLKTKDRAQIEIKPSCSSDAPSLAAESQDCGRVMSTSSQSMERVGPKESFYAYGHAPRSLVMIDGNVHTSLSISELYRVLPSLWRPSIDDVDGSAGGAPLMTDSRFRPDVAALLQGDLRKASRERKKLERDAEMAIRQREATGQLWQPAFFEILNKTQSAGDSLAPYKWKGVYPKTLPN